MTKTKLLYHHIATLRRRYPQYDSVWDLILHAVLEAVARQLDDEDQ